MTSSDPAMALIGTRISMTRLVEEETGRTWVPDIDRQRLIHRFVLLSPCSLLVGAT